MYIWCVKVVWFCVLQNVNIYGGGNATAQGRNSQQPPAQPLNSTQSNLRNQVPPPLLPSQVSSESSNCNTRVSKYCEHLLTSVFNTFIIFKKIPPPRVQLETSSIFYMQYLTLCRIHLHQFMSKGYCLLDIFGWWDFSTQQ